MYTLSTSDTAAKAIPIAKPKTAAGFVAPYVGRVVHADVIGPFGMTLIKSGDTITQVVADRAQAMGRLFELIAASETPDH